MKNKGKTRGFTLLEILIALAIFAVIGLVCAVGVRAVLATNERVSKAEARLQELVMATTIIRRDISQMIDRPIENRKGSKEQSLVIPNKISLEFTRAGFANPLGELPRSNLQRVRYVFEKNSITRTVWSDLDRKPSTRKKTTVILSGVKSIYLSYVDSRGELLQAWSTRVSDAESFPSAIILTVLLSEGTQLALVVPIRGRGNERM